MSAEEERLEELEELVDEYVQMVKLISEVGYSGAAPLVAPQLLQIAALRDIEIAISSFSDNVMDHLQTSGSTEGAAFTKWTTEELLKHYNPEVLDVIRQGNAHLDIYDDKVVITARKPA